MADLDIAEIPYESGTIRFRYSRYNSGDGMRWTRHGLFRAYHENGALASGGTYEHGVESGLWRYFHENGRLAAEGQYVDGHESGLWQHWDSNGSIE